MRMQARAVVVICMATLAVGCGGSESASSKVAAESKSQNLADESTCTKAGLMVYLANREDVYDCAWKRVGESYTYEGDDCYVYVESNAISVTDDLAKPNAEASNEFVCVLAKENIPPDKTAYEEAFYACNPLNSGHPRERFLRALADLYRARSTSAEDLSTALAEAYATVPETAFDRTAQAKVVWKQGCYDALIRTQED
jgi:hypothetical protein